MERIARLMEYPDPSLAYHVERDLLDSPEARLRTLRERIGRSGHCRLLLDNRNTNGHWGNGAYNPKWTCTHYVLFELMQLGMEPSDEGCRESIGLLLDYERGEDGGINYARTVKYSNVCVNGMLLAAASYFQADGERLEPIVDLLLRARMGDGGWNCEYVHGASKSSLHTTIAVLEGIERYAEGSYAYRRDELIQAKRPAIEFILAHRLYKTRTTGETIRDEFLKYTFPIRWRYDVLRCLDYFWYARVPYDERMEDAIRILEGSMTKKGRWRGYHQAGNEYEAIERDKWNTLRALRVLRYFNREPPEPAATA